MLTSWFLNTLFQGKEPGLPAEEGASRAGAGKIRKHPVIPEKRTSLRKVRACLKNRSQQKVLPVVKIGKISAKI